jgi:hypothetical protein
MMNASKAKAHQLIDALPDEKMSKVLIILEGVKDIIIEDEEPDEWDLQLVKEAQEALKNGEFIPFEEVLKEAGLNEKDLQDNI